MYLKKETPFSLSTITADNLEMGLFRYELAPQQRFCSVTSSLVQILDYKNKEHLLSEKLENLFFDPKDKNIFFEILNRNGSVKAFEASFKKKNSTPVWVSINACCVFSNDNKKYIEGVIQNISQQKTIQKKLLLEKDFLQGFFYNVPDAVYFKDKDNRIIKVNKFYVNGTGLPENEIIGKTDFDFFPYYQAKEMFEDDNVILKTGKPIIGKIEKTLLPNGTRNQVITTKIPIYDKSSRIIGTMGTTRDMTTYANFEKQRLDMVVNALEILGKALDLRDPYTFSHTRHVAYIAELIGQALKWSEDRILGLKLAGELHDLGKISIPLDILNKPGKLSALEFNLIQEHVINCYNLIKGIDFSFPIPEIVYQHHERLDGSGYPRKLKEKDILPESRILAVSDVLEAMTHHRPYRQALGIQKAHEELLEGKNTKYDAKIVEVLSTLIKKNGNKEFWLGKQ